MFRRNLIICRAGDRSLHREWLGDPATRSYDVWLDCWSSETRLWAEDPAWHSVGPNTTKWPRMAALLRERAHLLGNYQAVWFPDDDLRVDPGGVERLFDRFRALELSLAQPALTPMSFYTFTITLQNRAFLARYTNFVEVMAPVFSMEALRCCLPTFTESASGWGLDVVWPTLLGSPRDRIAVLDAAPVTHTQPPKSGAWYKTLRQAPADDLGQVARAHGVTLPFVFRQYGGITRDGTKLASGSRFVAKLALGAPLRHGWRRSYWKGQLASARAGCRR